MLLTTCSGLDVDGVDSSLDMVRRCRDNASRLGLEAWIYHQPVDELTLARRYPFIYFAGPTFNLLPDDDAARRALQRIGQGLIYSYPVTTSGGDWEIVQGLDINDFSRMKMDASGAELSAERAAVAELGLI